MNFEELCSLIAIFDLITVGILFFGVIGIYKYYYPDQNPKRIEFCHQGFYDKTFEQCLKDFMPSFTAWDWAWTNIFIAWDFLIVTWLNYKYFTGDYISGKQGFPDDHQEFCKSKIPEKK